MVTKLINTASVDMLVRAEACRAWPHGRPLARLTGNALKVWHVERRGITIKMTHRRRYHVAIMGVSQAGALTAWLRKILYRSENNAAANNRLSSCA